MAAIGSSGRRLIRSKDHKLEEEYSEIILFGWSPQSTGFDRCGKFQDRKGIPRLSDEEPARLARHTDKIQNDLAVGAITGEQLTYIIIALVTAVAILISVAAI